MAELKELAVAVARERWPTRTGLAVTLVLTIGLLVGVFAQIDLGDISPAEWGIILGAVLSVVLFWWRTRLPRVRMGRVCFGIAIHYEDQEQAKHLRADLLAMLRDLVMGSRFRHEFEFVEFTQSVAQIVAADLGQADRVARQANVRFLIWGRARLRPLPHGPSHVVDLRCLVRHAAIAKNASQTFGKELSAVLGTRWIFGMEGGVFACDFVARHLDAAARYIIGTAAAISNDFVYAEQLLLDAEAKVQAYVQKADGTPAAVLLDRVRARIGELYNEWLKRLAPRCYP